MLRSTDAVINLVAILHGSEDEFERTHVRLPARLAAACQTAGVRRVIHVSALGARHDAPSRYQRSKGRGEAALKARGARPDDPAPLGHLRRARSLPQPVRPACKRCCRCCRWPAPRPASSRSGWKTWRSAIVAAIDDPSTIGTTYRMLRAAQSTPSPTWCAPPAAGRAHPGRCSPCRPRSRRLQALLMECLPGTPLMSRDNLDSMRVANVASGKLPGLERLGIEPAPLEAIAPRYLGHVSGEKRLEAWRSRARRG